MSTRKRRRAGRGRRRLRLALVLAGVAVGIPLAMHESVRMAGFGRITDDPTEARRAPTAIVLGSGVRPDGTPRPVLEQRLATAAALWRAGKIDQVLVSGAGVEPHYDEPASMRRTLIELGVPPARIVEDPRGLRTLDSVVRASQRFGIEHALIVSQHYHLGRALFLADTLTPMECEGVAAPLGDESDLILGTPAREIAARVWAWIDVHVLGTEPSD